MNVMQSSRSGRSPARIRSASRLISVSVLPEPALASTCSGAGAVAAVRGAGFKPSRWVGIEAHCPIGDLVDQSSIPQRH